LNLKLDVYAKQGKVEKLEKFRVYRKIRASRPPFRYNYTPAKAFKRGVLSQLLQWTYQMVADTALVTRSNSPNITR
jgi:hypothetical protein